MVSRVRVVFFDAAGTLFHVKGSVGEAYLRYAEKYGVRRTDDTLTALNAAFRRAFHEAPPPVFAVNDPTELKRCERLWWFDVVHSVWYRVGMFHGFDEYFEDVFQAFGGADHWTLYPETVKVLNELKGSGLELGIISNFDTRLFNVLRGLGIAELFDTVTIASLAHAAKPASQIFRLALEKHAVDPEEAVHVGDSATDDVEGARQTRLHAVLIDRQRKDPDEHKPLGPVVPTIHTLDELPRVIMTLR